MAGNWPVRYNLLNDISSQKVLKNQPEVKITSRKEVLLELGYSEKGIEQSVAMEVMKI